MAKKYNVGIIGYTGMVGQELTRIFEDGAYGVLSREEADVTISYRRNSSGEEGVLADCDVVFLATKDQASLDSVQECLDSGCKVIDMSGAFRLDKEKFEKWYKIEHTQPELLKEAVYGMPAINREKIKTARLIANPGCYATSVIIALYPIKDLVDGEATVVATSGNSGARKSIEDVSDDWAYSYGHKHKHVPEMALYSGVEVNFTPVVLRSVFKGINANIRVKLCEKLACLSDEEARVILEDRIKNAYGPLDLVSVVRDNAEKSFGTRAVNDTNAVNIKVNVEDGYAYINSCLDNLGKGAASQAVQNFKIMCGIE
jgi:N-acetyl-gamma-glutamyl-phosphate reductase